MMTDVSITTFILVQLYNSLSRMPLCALTIFLLRRVRGRGRLGTRGNTGLSAYAHEENYHAKCC